MREPLINMIHLPDRTEVHQRIASLLAEAFVGDQIMIRLLGEEKWQRIVYRYFLLQLEHANLAITAEIDDELAGVLLAGEPGASLSGLRAALHMVRIASLLGRDYGATQKLDHSIARGVPSFPHWYINHLAVEPGFQSQGIGRKLVTSLIELAGHDQIYVDCERSLASFYLAAGFCKVKEFESLDMIVLGINE